MASDFGKTWWGNEWLRSLTNIDYANRIPRGARYARNGSVKKIVINDSVIEAKVQGSRRTPYSVTINVDKFSAKETDALMDGILAHPAIVAELLNRKLSPAVNDIAKESSLKVFPTSWRDLSMDCSCPDWAVPCKHIAAVIYMVGQEIDNNPFLVFKLHGVDIIGELAKRDIAIDAGKMSAVPDEREAFGLVPLLDKTDKKDSPQCLPHFDFSKIANLGEAILKLLPASPAFYADGDFMKRYDENMKRVANAARNIHNGKKYVYEALGSSIGHLPKKDASDIRLVVDKNHHVEAHFSGYKTKNSVVDLMEYLSALPEEKIYESSNTVFAFRSCFVLALRLAVKGNIEPVIVQQKDGSVNVVWAPFMSDKQTAAILEQLDAFFTKDSIVLECTGRSKLVPSRPAWFICSCFLTVLVRQTHKPLTWWDKVYELFFDDDWEKFDGVGEKNVPGGIKSWTDHLSAPQLRYLPMIMVRDESEDGSEFLLEMTVADAQANDQTEVALHDVFTDKTYQRARYNILRDVSLLSSLVPGIDQYLANEARKPMAMDNAAFSQFLINVVPAMRLLNIRLLLPKSLQHLLRPKPSVSLSAKQSDGKSFLRLDQLLQFDWKVAVGDDLISPEEFRGLLGRAEGLIRFKQQYIYVTADDLKRIEKAFASRNEMTPARMLQVALSGEYKSAKVSISPEVKELIRKWTTQQEIEVPKEIHATLRPYQKRGYEWMYQNMRLGFGSILADDMGLGKTLQVITLLQRLKDDGQLERQRAIVVAPTGLLANWQAELQHFAPTLSVFVYHGQRRNLKEFDADILLTSYGLVRSDIDQLKKLK